MPNILVMIPSGEVYDHDCVRWYNYKDVQGNLNHYHNIGDAFVFDSSLKLLNYDRLDVLKIREVRREDIDRYNAEYDYCFLRGSNYIHGSMEWENAIPVLEQLKIPVLAFGIGAQAPSTGKMQLSDTTKRVLRLIADHSVSLGVRGEFTAEVLWDLGIKNARVVGCPTLYRNNNPELRVTLPDLDQVRDVVFTLRREVSGSYASDIERYLTLHHDSIVELSKRFNVIVSAQGEIEEKKILWGTAEQREEAMTQLAHEKWFTGPDDPMIRLYRDKLFYSDVVTEYEQLMRAQDLVLGYRLHGNLMALASGVPSVYFTYDSRTAEFVDTYRIPAFDVFSGKDFRLEDYWDQSLFERFNRAYHARYRDMKLFLDENGIDHKMGRATEAGSLRSAA
ncbi:MAG: polysaccharide pyruvyl transferase family protein [Magnetospirillum sp.]|nr:polysaccharide pyruvyl transferase family protein [Magnetospirillum sp.]